MRYKSPDKPKKGGPTRGGLSSEKGTILKKWGGKIPVCVVFPNSYHIGMSNLSVQILYKALNDMPDIVCERCFFEEGKDIRSLESSHPLLSFRIIFFTISYELDYVNIIKILRSSNIGLDAVKRNDDEPIIVGGGICIMSNPEPIYNLFDLFIMGDIESTITSFVESFMATKEKKKDDIIGGLSTKGWVYNPKSLNVSYNEDGTLQSFVPASFSVNPYLYEGRGLGSSTVIAHETEFSDMLLVEGTRGCPSRCPFCLLGNTYEFSYDNILPISTQADDIGIIGGGVSFHPFIVDIVREMKAAGKRIHFPSLRIDKTPIDLIELMKDDIKTLTFGIEAGTERLRKSIGKPISDMQLLEKMDNILSIKPFNLKLYFMVGLFGETINDLGGIVDTVKHIRHIMIKKGAKKGFIGSITVHASPFVPKPATPFQWLPMLDMETMKKRLVWLKREFSKVDNTYFTHESIKYSFLQGVFSRGDRRLKEVLLRLSMGEGFSRALKQSPVNLNFYVLRERSYDEILPWDFITSKVSKKRLYETFISLIPHTT